jgi:hypothetical protein
VVGVQNQKPINSPAEPASQASASSPSPSSPTESRPAWAGPPAAASWTEAARSIGAADEGDSVHFWRFCKSNPSESVPEPPHECMQDELRCVYCGVRLKPIACNGCGRFLSLKEHHDNESRCNDCG